MVDLKNTDDLRAWLEGRPREDAVLVAARLALRVLPLIEGCFEKTALKRPRHGILRVFRAIQLASYTGLGRTYTSQDLRVSAQDAAKAADNFAKSLRRDGEKNDMIQIAEHAVHCARKAARAASRSTSAISDAFEAASSAELAVYERTRGSLPRWIEVMLTTGGSSRQTREVAEVHASITTDVSALANGQDHKVISSFPLWQDGTPHWAHLSSQSLIDRLATAPKNEGWSFWISWYRARLKGTNVDPEREKAVASIGIENWRNGPRTIAANIVELSSSSKPNRSESRKFPPSASTTGATSLDSDRKRRTGESLTRADGAPQAKMSGKNAAPLGRSNIGEHGSSSITAKQKKNDRHENLKEEAADSARSVATPSRDTEKSVYESTLQRDGSPTIAFFSYTRLDDHHTNKLLSKVRKALEDRVHFLNGVRLEIFQDVDDIEAGEIWRDRLERALAEATIFLPVITPSFYNSKHCLEELSRFLDRDDAQTLIIPLHFVDTEDVRDDEAQRLKSVIDSRQWIDWREHNGEVDITPEIRKAVNAAAKTIRDRWIVTRR